ncbi:hypothetical protein FQN60_001888 [Etheostoma spectabile]|uniref:Uncharacterized protein n=1 Tax=Etheostoma spectabile TaxID=54343 RepID=A0A5J5DD10_9PERO|nr:hypothetical protein FQN60_001888 [Etheostoma spectabile]
MYVENARTTWDHNISQAHGRFNVLLKRWLDEFVVLFDDTLNVSAPLCDVPPQSTHQPDVGCPTNDEGIFGLCSMFVVPGWAASGVDGSFGGAVKRSDVSLDGAGKQGLTWSNRGREKALQLVERTHSVWNYSTAFPSSFTCSLLLPSVVRPTNFHNMRLQVKEGPEESDRDTDKQLGKTTLPLCFKLLGSLCLVRRNHRGALFGLAAPLLTSGGTIPHLSFDPIVLRRFTLGIGDHFTGCCTKPVLRR